MKLTAEKLFYRKNIFDTFFKPLTPLKTAIGKNLLTICILQKNRMIIVLTAEQYRPETISKFGRNIFC
jgi:hypothetical protein